MSSHNQAPIAFPETYITEETFERQGWEKIEESGEDLDSAITDELGKPDEIQEVTEDGFLFKKMVWNTPHGQFVKIVVTVLDFA